MNGLRCRRTHPQWWVPLVVCLAAATSCSSSSEPRAASPGGFLAGVEIGEGFGFASEISPNGTELLYRYGDDTYRLAQLDGPAAAAPTGFDRSVVDADDVTWYNGAELSVRLPDGARVIAAWGTGPVAYVTRDDATRTSTLVVVEQDGATVGDIQLGDATTDVAVHLDTGVAYWVASDAESPALWRQALVEGTRAELARWPFRSTFGGFDITPDGATIAYTLVPENTPTGNGDLMVIPSDGGAARTLASALGRPAFDPSGRRIAFIQQAAKLTDDGRAVTSIGVVPTTGGNTTLLPFDDEVVASGVGGWAAGDRILVGIASYGFDGLLGVVQAPAP